MKKKLIVSIFLFIFTIISVYFVINYFLAAKNQNSQIIDVIDKLDSQFLELGEIIDEDLELPSTLVGYDDVIIGWSSSKPNIISDDGVVNRPLYLEGDMEVVLTARIRSKAEGLKLQMISYLGYKEDIFVVNVTVKAFEATDLEKITVTVNDLIVPLETNTDINLLKTSAVFDDVLIKWSSSDPSVLSVDGLIKGYGDVVLTARVSIGDIFTEKEFNCSVIDQELTVLMLDENFSEYEIKDYEDSWVSEDNLFKITDGLIIEKDDKKVLNIKTSSLGSIEFLNGNFSGVLSFSYQYLSNIEEEVYLKIYYAVKNDEYRLFENIDISEYENNVYTYDFTYYEKVKFIFESSSDDLTVDVLNIVIKHTVTEENIVNSLENLIPDVINESINLPTTTIYGGSVSWVSSHPDIISSSGVLNLPTSKTSVTLTATISYFEDDITYAVNIEVGEGQEVPSVYVYFLDVGKYGDSDMGESMMIKVGDYEVIIDAGDRYSDSTTAVLEQVHSITNDKIIELAIATHPHSDHIGSMDDVFAEFDVLNLITFEGTYTTGVYNDYVSAYQAEDCNVFKVLDVYNNIVELKREFEIVENVSIEIINTTYYSASDLNSRSIVFVLDAYGTRVLFTADADNNKYQIESTYMNDVGDIDILKVVHHGSKYGTSSQFLDVVMPEVAIITNGNYLGNSNTHPTPEAINRIYQYNNETKIYAVTGGNGSGSDRFYQRNGLITIEITLGKYIITSEYNFDEPIELSSTDFWINHPSRVYNYIN